MAAASPSYPSVKLGYPPFLPSCWQCPKTRPFVLDFKTRLLAQRGVIKSKLWFEFGGDSGVKEDSKYT